MDPAFRCRLLRLRLLAASLRRPSSFFISTNFIFGEVNRSLDRYPPGVARGKGLPPPGSAPPAATPWAEHRAAPVGGFCMTMKPARTIAPLKPQGKCERARQPVG